MDRLWAMEVFARVTECESFSRAAESLELANATVTSCVRNLEKHLGVTLLQRNTRHLRLTEPGELFYARCKVLLADVQQAEQEVAQCHAAVRGTLRVEAPIAIGHALLLPALPGFLARHPGFSIHVNLTNQPRALIQQGIDLAIRMDAVEDADLVARPLYTASYILCASPRVAATADPASPAKLDAARCLGLLPDGKLTPKSWELAHGKETVTIEPRGPIALNNSDALVRAAVEGIGIVRVLDLFARKQLADGSLVRLFPEWASGGRSFHLVMPKTSFTPSRVKEFSDFLLEVVCADDRPDHRERIPVQKSR
ncbi:LysR family transcriptional regulator [Cupriavidus sp. CP313]